MIVMIMIMGLLITLITMFMTNAIAMIRTIVIVIMAIQTK